MGLDKETGNTMVGACEGMWVVGNDHLLPTLIGADDMMEDLEMLKSALVFAKPTCCLELKEGLVEAGVLHGSVFVCYDHITGFICCITLHIYIKLRKPQSTSICLMRLTRSSNPHQILPSIRPPSTSRDIILNCSSHAPLSHEQLASEEG